MSILMLSLQYALYSDGIFSSSGVPYLQTIDSSLQAYKQHIQRIPEDPNAIQSILKEIECRNSLYGLGQTQSWPTQFSPEMNQCQLCSSQLTPPSTMPGSNGKSYLLTKVGLLPVKAMVKRCVNPRCTARHSYWTWKKGT